MLLIRKAGESGWHTPKVKAYSDEQVLQGLIEQSPDLLPGSKSGAVTVVRELAVPPVGYIDLIAVDVAGGITVVECKLKANPEIRRHIVGQVLAYAAALWNLTYDAFDSAFAARAGTSLSQSTKEVATDDWNEEAFRANVTANLAAGRFRLVIVVDEITDELKRIVLYLNEHTNTELEILALELGYIADEGVEILAPAVYGEESAQNKVASGRRRWDENSVFESLTTFCSPAGVQVAQQLYKFAKSRKAVFGWGEGSYAAVTARFPIQGKHIPVFSLYEWPKGKGVVSINFEYMAGAVSAHVLEQFADRLRTIPGVQARLANLEEAGFKKRPSLPLEPLLTQTGAIDTIMGAIDELLQTEAI